MSEEAPKRVASIIPSRFKVAEYQRTVYVVNPEIGTTVNDMLRPEYWAHVGHQMKPYDRIEVRAEDGSYFAELLVRNAERGWANVTVLSRIELDAKAEPAPVSIDFKVEHAGPHHKWRVMRLSDTTVVKHGFENKTEANQWLGQYIKTIAA